MFQNRDNHMHSLLGRCQTLDIHWMVCFLKKGRVQSHDFFAFATKQFSDSYITVTKPAYALSLGHSSRQSYKLFKVFKQPWMKDDNNHLASELSKNTVYHISEP